MKCPACGIKMVEKNFGNIMVDVCENGCNGIWFDWFELSKLDEINEGFGKALQTYLNKEIKPVIRAQEKLNCPKCDIPMHTHKYQDSKKVTVDECYSCGGFFLDPGELAQIRNSFMTQEEEEAYINRLIDNLPEFSSAKEDLEKKRQRTQAIRRFTKHFRLHN